MPNYRGHLIGGTIVFAAGSYVLAQYNRTITAHPTLLGMLGIVTLLGCLFPDVDTKSKGQRIFYVLAIPPLAYSLAAQRWHYTIVILTALFIPLIARHRGITHKVWFVILFPAGVMMFIHHHVHTLPSYAFYLYLFFVGGALSHIILDRSVSALKKF